MRLDTNLLTLVAEELIPYKDDEDAYLDTLDGETDVLDLVGETLKRINEADAGVIACKTLMQQYQERKSLHEHRKEKLNKILKTVLLCTEQSKIPHELATVSLRKGTESVSIIDEKEIPSQLCKVSITPDKTEIKKQLKAGIKIDGAELVTGAQTVSIRMK
jgi:hypothetical protein